MSRLELRRAKRDGERVGVGMYELDGLLHIDLEEMMLASGMDPRNPVHVEQATAVASKALRDAGMPAPELRR